MKHLWEHDHPYYMAEGCYHERGHAHRFDSWAAFLAEWDYADEDYNRVHRFDWAKHSDGEHNLSIFYVMQRKGFCVGCHIKVNEQDEPDVVEWLSKKWAYECKVWAPFSDGMDVDPSAMVKALRDARIATLRAELAALEASQ